MTHEVNTKWQSGLTFESAIGDHKIIMDAEGKGPKPKPLLLSALAGCTGMDIASLIKKMKIEVEDFDIHVKAEMTEEHPKYYKKIHIVYTFSGDNLNTKKIERAVELSQEKYCGISEMLRKSSELTYEIVYKEK